MSLQAILVAPAETGAAIVIADGCQMLPAAPASAGATLEGAAL